MIRFAVAGVLVLAGVLLFSGGDAGGQSQGINPVGFPTEFAKSTKNAYAVWYKDGYWNIRVHSKLKGDDKKGKDKDAKEKEKTAFTGSVHVVGGYVIDGDLPNLDKASKKQNADWVFPKLTARGCTGFDFRWHTSSKKDSIRFSVSKEATEVGFKLLIEGAERPQLIMIGPDGQKPKAADFTLPAHPR